MNISLRTAVSAALVLAAPAVFAANRSVCATGCQYSTIQSAIDAASDGDVIQIAKGRYIENLSISAKRVTLQGADRRTTIIDGNGQGAVVTVAVPTGESLAQVSISGLTITRGFGPNGGGVSVFPGGALTVRHTTVVGNHSTGAGGGINVVSTSPLTIADSTITNNTAQGSGGGLFASGENTTVSITRSTFSANSAAQGAGGGIALTYDGSNLSVTDTDLADNSANEGGGLYAGSGLPQSNLTLQNVVASGNSSSSDAGGMFLGATTTAGSVVLAHNTAATTGGGLIAVRGLHGAGGVTLKGVYVVQNTAGTGGGGIENEGGLVIQPDVVVADNQPDNCAQLSSASGCP